MGTTEGISSSLAPLERFVLSPDNVWYGRLKLRFTISVKIDGQDEPVDLECAYVSFCYEIKLEPSGVQQYVIMRINMT